MEMSHRSESTWRSPRRPSRTCGRPAGLRRTTRCCSCRAAPASSSPRSPLNLLPRGRRAPTTSRPASGRRRPSRKRAATAPSMSPPVPRRYDYFAIPGRTTGSCRRRGLRALPAATRPSAACSSMGAARWASPAGGGHVLGHPLPADRRVEVRPDLRRRAEEHRPERPGGGDHPRRPARSRPLDLPDHARLQGRRRQRLDVQHPGDLFLVPLRPGLRVAEGAGRRRGDGEAQPGQEGPAVQGHRRQRLLHQPDQPRARVRG